MTLEQLLSMLRVSILNDRSDRIAGDSDYLWTDETLVAYISEAQRRFAVKGLVLRDASTAEVVRVRLREGVTSYTLHDAVIAVASAKREDQDADLVRVGHSLLAGYRQPSDTWVDPATLTTMPAGPPLAYSTDEGLEESDNGDLSTISLRVYPAPSEAMDDTYLRLRVVRKPLNPLTVNNLQARPEIPEDHHIEMLDWAAYLALRIADSDAGNMRLAQTFQASFEDHVNQARKTALRKLFAPMPWAVGARGWSWGS